MKCDAAPVCSCSSGHRAARTRFVSEMMQTGRGGEGGIHSYGRCANNREMPFDTGVDGGDHPHRQALGQLVAAYKSYLALDNSLCDECVLLLLLLLLCPLHLPLQVRE